MSILEKDTIKTNAIQLLVSDHIYLLKICEEINKTDIDENERRDKAFKELDKLLLAHTQSEELFLYPELEKVCVLKDAIEKSYESHHLIRANLGELHALPYRSSAWKTKFQILWDNLKNEVKEEENKLFPIVNKYLTELKLIAIARQMLHLRQTNQRAQVR